ncbi:MAG: PD-(D/E)XK nuclease family protein [Pyrinomonadaceae bacterium]
MPQPIREFGYTDTLGWSYTRYSTFQSCKRQYYFEKYAKYDLDHDLFKINMLKKLTTVPLEVGDTSHKLIKTLLDRLKRSSEEISVERFRDYARREASTLFQSRTFEDIYYGRSDEIDFETEIFEPVWKGMENFLQSDRLKWLFEEALVYKDDWIIEPRGYGEFRIDGLKAYCRVDFLFPIGDELHIIDWKTGKQDYQKHSMQLRGYAYWANFHLKKDYPLIETTIAHLLPEYKEITARLNEYDIEAFADTVREQTDEMYLYCADTELNVPLPKEEFTMTEHLNFCKTCKFRELCDRAS